MPRPATSRRSRQVSSAATTSAPSSSAASRGGASRSSPIGVPARDGDAWAGHRPIIPAAAGTLRAMSDQPAPNLPDGASGGVVAPGGDGRPTHPPDRRRAAVWREIGAVLGVSLGASALWSLLAIVDKLTRAVALNAQTTTMNNSVTPDRPWLDLAYQLTGIGLAVVPGRAWPSTSSGRSGRPGPPALAPASTPQQSTAGPLERRSAIRWAGRHTGWVSTDVTRGATCGAAPCSRRWWAYPGWASTSSPAGWASTRRSPRRTSRPPGGPSSSSSCRPSGTRSSRRSSSSATSTRAAGSARLGYAGHHGRLGGAPRAYHLYQGLRWLPRQCRHGPGLRRGVPALGTGHAAGRCPYPARRCRLRWVLAASRSRRLALSDAGQLTQPATSDTAGREVRPDATGRPAARGSHPGRCAIWARWTLRFAARAPGRSRFRNADR